MQIVIEYAPKLECHTNKVSIGISYTSMIT